MVPYTCMDHGEAFMGEAGVIEHLRGSHTDFIKRPGRLGTTDSHGHIWYCFECEGPLNDHRSYDSDIAMLNHLNQCHEDVMESITRNSKTAPFLMSRTKRLQQLSPQSTP